MSVSTLRDRYLWQADSARDMDRMLRDLGITLYGNLAWLYVEATSVALDMAMAAESDDRIRATVAY